jgi:uridine kinase
MHFYRYSVRFDELFAEVVEPLVRDRRLHLSTLGIRTDRDAWEPLVYAHEDIDVVVLEGILLFRRDLRDRYDLRIWIDCSFETALSRALARNVEDQAPEQLLKDYARIYHAAQRWHFTIDAPRDHADLIVPNDLDAEMGRSPCARE